MARKKPFRQKNAIEKVKDLIDQVDAVVGSDHTTPLSQDSFAESMRLIDKTIPSDMKESENLVLDWISATLEEDEETIRELGWTEEMKRYRI